MPIATTYPGVYIEELAPAGAPAIAPVSTSLTALVGRALTGPVDEPMTIFNFGDFTRLYGGLSADYPLSYAVNDFFNNGGSEAIIARLFEPTPGQGDGVAQLPFPPSPPPLPENWQLSATATAGANSVAVQEPTGAEGEPVLGMIFTLGTGRTAYTVTDYTPATAKDPASVAFMPKLGDEGGATLPICTPLTFSRGPTPAGWTLATISKDTVTLTGGSGIPQMGDHIVFDGDDAEFTLKAQPTLSENPDGSLTVAATLTTAPPSSILSGAKTTITPPVPGKIPVNWQIDAADPTAKSPNLTLVNGANAPVPGDHFTVGTRADVFIVTKFTAGTDKTAYKSTLEFTPMPGATMPTDPTAFCFCCDLNFSRPPPTGWSIAKSAKAGDTSIGLSSPGGDCGVVDVGDTFQVQGSPIVYTIVLYDSAGKTASFLPKADRALDSTSKITFSPPLSLKAANPGAWGNALTASVDTQGITDATVKMFASYGLTKDDLFNLSLRRADDKGKTIATERYLNVAVKNTGAAARFPNRLDRVLKNQSSLARVARLSMIPPSSGATCVGAHGDDGAYLTTQTYLGSQETRTGIYMLDHVPIFNLLCIPPDRRADAETPLAMQDLDKSVRSEAAHYCTDRRAIYIVDPPAIWANQVSQGKTSDIRLTDVGISGVNSAGEEVERNAAVYFPRLIQEDLMLKNQLEVFPPSGAVAGIIAANDVSRGVWSAPAGVQAGMSNVSRFEAKLNDDQNGILNPEAINCLRSFPLYGPVVWGARTMRGATQLEDEYMYLNVRRLTLFVESSLYYGTYWAVFQNNDEALWSSLRLSVNNFLSGLAKQGAFYDYSVACDASTTTSADIDAGRVNILVKIAPVKPAEFVVIEIQQTKPPSS